MTCLVSLISTFKGVGLSSQFTEKWLSSWGISWLVAFPVLLFVLPIVRKITTSVVKVV
ncbi:DUF2798 domain-containing protein [Pectobacterium sp. A5351]|uniref:DUF2798 domain-containing protein n=1 Tax=Pectobacterium sp. A5351 TaxID=2914983 RepID=UPI00232E23B6|nr:DUF2798 domain-containing protein [Pectobacterium sp. A5351]WCG85039.1 DUF2798 domain-containing protein [Pectobacterium sp. A5351]